MIHTCNWKYYILSCLNVAMCNPPDCAVSMFCTLLLGCILNLIRDNIKLLEQKWLYAVPCFSHVRCSELVSRCCCMHARVFFFSRTGHEYVFCSVELKQNCGKWSSPTHELNPPTELGQLIEPNVKCTFNSIQRYGTSNTNAFKWSVSCAIC